MRGHFSICILRFVTYYSLSPKMDVIVTLDGYTLPSGFILKELCIMHPSGEYDHFLFSKPDVPLLAKDLETIRYTTAHLNNISFDDGNIPYELIQPILGKVKYFRIYTYSAIALNFLRQYLPTTFIKNVQDIENYKLPAELPDSNCFRNHNQRYCAKAKAIAVKEFMNS